MTARVEVERLTESAWAVLRRRYLRRDGQGAPVETPEQLFTRVARAVAAPDASHGASAAEVAATEERFYRRMARLEFLPNSPALMNAGRPRGQLAACFVVPVGDSMPEIFDAVKWAAEIQQTGGGTGFAFSRLRPSGDRVASTGGVASGPLAFMDVFNAATDAVKQGGTRRGANMGVLRVDHPDILEFIAAKLDPARLTNFNVSVAVTDTFMDAAARGGDYELINPRTGQPSRRLDARRVLHAISTGAWKSGEPGVLFIDRMNAQHPIADAGAIEATNPCVTGDTRVLVEGRGWLPIRDLVGTTPRIATLHDGRGAFLTATRVWRTGVRPIVRLRTDKGGDLRVTADHRVATDRGDVPAVDLVQGDRIPVLITHGHHENGFTRQPQWDGEKVTVLEVVSEAGEQEVFDLTEPETSHFFANGLLVHNCGEQPLLAFESCVLGSVNVARFVEQGRVAWGRLGEAVRDGVHFLDNVIDANHYPLPQIEAVTRAHRKIGLGVMGFADMLVAIGVPYDSAKALEVAAELAAFVEKESLAASEELARRRGPFARFATSRWAHGGRAPLRNATTTTIAPTGTISIIAGCSSGIEPLFALSLVRRVLDGARLAEVHPQFQAMAEERGIWSDALADELAERGGARGLGAVPAEMQRLFPTAHDVAPEQHVRMQAAFQRFSHSAVSKTVNLPREATVEDVERVYRLAYELGCKGVTVYRDGSRDAQVLSYGASAREAEAASGSRCPECGERPLGDGACCVCPACGWAKCAVP